MSTHDDVREFMRIAQSEFIAKKLTSPEASGFGKSLLISMAERLTAYADALKEELTREGLPPASRATTLGARLMLEELGETLKAMAEGNVVEMADGLADLKYVTHWTALAHGIDLDSVSMEVHRSNMMKFPVCGVCLGVGAHFSDEPCDTCKGVGQVAVRDASGKIQKPAGWQPPNISQVLAKAEEDRIFEAEHSYHEAASKAFQGRKT